MARLSILLIFLTLLGCRSVDTPTAHVRGARLESVSVDGFTLGVDLAVSNPNDFDIPMPRVAYDVDIMSENLVKGQIRTADLRLPAGQTRSVTVPVAIRYEELLDLTDALLATGGEFNYHLEGKAHFRAPGLPGLFGTIAAPFTFDGKLPLRAALRDPQTLADPNGRRLAGELFRRFFEGR